MAIGAGCAANGLGRRCSKNSLDIANGLPNMTTAEILELALHFHRAGDLLRADPLYRNAIQTDPENSDLWSMWGACAIGLGRLDDAVTALRTAIALNSHHAPAHDNLGIALAQLGKPEEAVECFRKSVQINPHNAAGFENLGITLAKLARFEEASHSYQRAIAIDPRRAECYVNLAELLTKQVRYAEAETVYRQALVIQPDFPGALARLGNVVKAQHRIDEAIRCYEASLQLSPEQPITLNNLGVALLEQGRLEEATVALESSIRLKPDYGFAYSNLSNASRASGQIPAAIAQARRALELQPNSAEAHNSLGAALLRDRSLDAAAEAFQQAIALKSDYGAAWVNLGNTRSAQGEIAEALECYRRAMQIDPSDPLPHSNLVYMLHYDLACDSHVLRQEHRRWQAHHAAPLKPRVLAYPNDPAPQRKLKIGYVSPHFCDHCQAFFLMPLLTHHNRQHFEVHCYADVSRPDAVTARLQAYADGWHSTAGKSDAQVAESIRSHGIDILVDLSLHMEQNRLLVFARKPAPVQVTWLGYPSTTGLDTIDYRLTDPFLDPPELNGHRYSEESIYLPDTFWCYDPLTSEPSVNTLPALAASQFTFGCLNNFCKVNDGVLELWARVLGSVPRSRMLIACHPGAHRRHTLEVFQAAGIAMERIEFVPYCKRNAYLERYHQIDLALDTFPYNSHTTSLDALWMGVPTVTWIGTTPVARAGWSQLSNIGLREFAANSAADFVKIAAQWADNLPELNHIRSSLRSHMQQSPLMDAARFAGHIEDAFRSMWQRWCANPQPSQITAAPRLVSSPFSAPNP
jgi:protein O-GlcNAc transferase